MESNGLKGSIGEFTTADVIQLISMGGKTGRLHFMDGHGCEGSLYFECGYIVHADSGSLEGEEAARFLVGFHAGFFEFIPREKPSGRSVMLAGHELLMRSAQSTDEDRFLENGGQLVLAMADHGDDPTAEARDQIRVLLSERLGRRSKFPLIALQACEDRVDSLLDVCERIERYIALFVDETLAVRTGEEMRKVLGF